MPVRGIKMTTVGRVCLAFREYNCFGWLLTLVLAERHRRLHPTMQTYGLPLLRLGR